MKGIDFQFEEIHISKTVCLFLQCLDLVVGTFQRTCGNREIEIGKDSLSMRVESLRKPVQHGNI